MSLSLKENQLSIEAFLHTNSVFAKQADARCFRTKDRASVILKREIDKTYTSRSISKVTQLLEENNDRVGPLMRNLMDCEISDSGERKLHFSSLIMVVGLRSNGGTLFISCFGVSVVKVRCINGKM